MKFSFITFYVTSLFLFANNSDSIQYHAQQKFPYIQPIAVEEISQLQKIPHKVNENLNDSNISTLLLQ